MVSISNIPAKWNLLFIVSILFLLSSPTVFPGFAQRQIRNIDEKLLDRVRKEVKESPTNQKNMIERHKILMGWAHKLLQEGVNIEKAFPREEAMKLMQMAKNGNTNEACSRIDEAFKSLEGILTSKSKKIQAPSQPRLDPVETAIKTNASKVKILNAMPIGQSGAKIAGTPDFGEDIRNSENGKIVLKLTDEPTWIIEGNLPKEKCLSADDSPFGFHPASIKSGQFRQINDYSCAEDIGVTWDRDGLYLAWVLVQPVLNEDCNWNMFDSYFKNLPRNFKPLKNITVAHDGMVKVAGRREMPGKSKRREVDVSQHLDGTSYRPKDAEAYSKWVKAAVERYDGDGTDDMPGLQIAAKHWQVDNEPPRLREGYTDLVLITSKAIKEADPEAKVLIGGLQLPCGQERMISNYHRTQAPLIKELNGKGIDIVDYHWFGQKGEWKMLPEAMRTVLNDLKKYGFPDISIWFTEMGTYSGLPAAMQNGDLPFQSEREQAAEMVKRYVVALSERVEKIFWAWGMKEGFINENDNDFFDNTGFIYDGNGPNDPGEGTKKLIYFTHRNMSSLLQYWDGKAPKKLETEKNVFAYRFNFKNAADSGIIVAWVDENPEM
ncbi:MAG: hypothetical protein KKB51_03675 [Candidatus Riflebacteria bacterium]|nr:hypothetical protein [Candidatus Riflebacteria bacterium]